MSLSELKLQALPGCSDKTVLLLSKINDCNRDDYVTFMIEKPDIARIKKVNVRDVE